MTPLAVAAPRCVTPCRHHAALCQLDPPPRVAPRRRHLAVPPLAGIGRAAPCRCHQRLAVLPAVVVIVVLPPPPSPVSARGGSIATCSPTSPPPTASSECALLLLPSPPPFDQPAPPLQRCRFDSTARHVDPPPAIAVRIPRHHDAHDRDRRQRRRQEEGERRDPPPPPPPRPPPHLDVIVRPPGPGAINVSSTLPPSPTSSSSPLTALAHPSTSHHILQVPIVG